MAKIVGKGRKTWKDGSVMTYTITDDGVLTISGTLPLEDYVDIRSKAPFRHLVIEDGVKFIGRKNFSYWEEIEELTLPPSVKILRIRAFEKCTNLKCVHFSEGLETIGKEAFYECKSLEKVMFPKSLQKISQFSFFCCDSLKKVKIPGSVKVIEYKAFAGCHNLSEVVLSSGLENISDEAFKWCNALEKINFPKTLNRIGKYAFSQSDKMKDIVLPNKNISLGFEAFGADEGDTVTGEDGQRWDGESTLYYARWDETDSDSWVITNQEKDELGVTIYKVDSNNIDEEEFLPLTGAKFKLVKYKLVGNDEPDDEVAQRHDPDPDEQT